ncbi:unnamed protein product, partial [Heterosigma akashiwo]
TRDQIVFAIAKLKNKKAAGLDGIRNEVIKWASPWIIDTLVVLFNDILSTNYFPDMWNITALRPLFKADDPNDPNNFRGISLLPCLGKLFFFVLS